MSRFQCLYVLCALLGSPISAALAETPDPPPVTSALVASFPAPKPEPLSVTLPADDSQELTYAQALARARATGKPLAIWVGGDFCPRCVRESSEEFIHFFTDTFPGVVSPAIVVGVKESPASDVLVWVETVDWWIEGDKEFGHSPTIRGAVRRWLDRRAQARVERRTVTHTHIPATITKTTARTIAPAPPPIVSIASAPVVTYSAPLSYPMSYGASYGSSSMWSGSYGVSAGGCTSSCSSGSSRGLLARLRR